VKAQLRLRLRLLKRARSARCRTDLDFINLRNACARISFDRERRAPVGARISRVRRTRIGRRPMQGSGSCPSPHGALRDSDP
jgi:hypothetical protein